MIQVDYYFPLDIAQVKGLSAVDSRTGYCFSTLVRWKGSSDRFAVGALTQFLDELGYPEITLQVDEEQASVDWTRTLEKYRDKVLRVMDTLNALINLLKL